MAEVTAFRNNALPYPVYGVPWVVVFPLLDADGDPVTGATCDSEVSKNGDTGADCTNEGVEITYTTATNKGMYYLILTAAEMTADIVAVTVYSATSKATAITLYPRKLVTLASGTSAGGAAGYITLAASTVAFDGQFNGCLCVATIDTNVEARVLQACTTADQQCTVTPEWNVAPDADDTFVVYLPEGMQIPQADIVGINSTAGRAADLAEIVQYLFANSATLTDIIADDSVWAKMVATGGDISGFDEDTDSQQAIRDAITAASDANYSADASSTVTDGSVQSGTYASTATDDGTRWVIQMESDTDTEIDVTCEFNLGTGRIATSVVINGFFDAGGVRACQVYAYNYTTAGWDKLSFPGAKTELRNSAVDSDYIFSLSSAHTNPAATVGEVKIRFYTDGDVADEDDLHIDYIAVTGGVAGGATPEAIAEAVHSELEDHFLHIPSFTGSIRYVDGTNGSDGNDGLHVDRAFATIQAAEDASAAGDMIRVFAGTYSEAVTMDTAGVELICELGTDIDGATGVPVTVSASNCRVFNAHLTPDAGQIGMIVSSDYNYIELCDSHDTGLSGFQVAATAEGNQFVKCNAQEFTGAGWDIKGFNNIFQQCMARGKGGTEKGFHLSDTAAHRNLFNTCATIDCATAGWDVDAGADDNLFLNCADSDGCGAMVDGGANNAWRNFGVADTMLVDLIDAPNATAITAIKTEMEKADGDLDLLVRALVNKMAITEATGNTQLYDDADSASGGAIASAFTSDGTTTSRLRLVP